MYEFEIFLWWDDMRIINTALEKGARQIKFLHAISHNGVRGCIATYKAPFKVDNPSYVLLLAAISMLEKQQRTIDGLTLINRLV